jgi:cell wall-associated NlpC family hydrolase
MRARVERLVEDHNEVRGALARTRVEQARTRRRVLEAPPPPPRRGLLGRRLWTSYTGGAPSPYRRAGVWQPWAASPQGGLVFVATDTGNPTTIHHVGMYVGGGATVEAPCSGARVRIPSIGRRDHIGAIRPTG